MAKSSRLFRYVSTCSHHIRYLGLYSQNNQTNSTTGTNNTTGGGSLTSNTSNLCFQPNDNSCDDSVLPPVICPEQTNTTCALTCSLTPSCINDPNHHGSFCKLDSNVCFGLYWTNSSQTEACFQPSDPNCPSTFPVSCGGENVPTTAFPPSTMTETTETPTEMSTTGPFSTEAESTTSS